ncbi:MAG TPA: mechanosensitive ion channel family protein [Bacteriovoracaceae bacterium]|nr:mechanosensitive ion channel family protein [Bacteriovoracaceae bacterium]
MKNLLPNPYLLGFGITLLCYILIYGLKRMLSIRLGEYLHKTKKNKWDDIVVNTFEQTKHFFMLGSAIYIAFSYMPHHKEYNLYVDRAWFILLMIQVAIWANCLLDQWIVSSINRKTRHNRAAASSIGLLKLVSKFMLFSIVFLFTLNNLDIKITTIVAGFGVGGIAVALAIQKVLGDLFSSLSIVLDKPFVVGDFIIMDQYLGEVEKIGLRTTHIRALGGEQIIVPNSDIMGTRIRNMKRMHERRVALLFSLKLETEPEGIESAVSVIKAIVAAKPNVRYDRCHLSHITRTSFDIELIYFYLSDDYNLHMDMQEQILLEIYKAFRSEKLDFAYPAQVLHHIPSENMQRPLDYISSIDGKRLT